MPRKALTRTRRHGSVRFDSSVSEKMANSEMLQIANNKTIGLTDVELTSVVSPLHSHVSKDQKSCQLQAAGTDMLFGIQVVRPGCWFHLMKYKLC